MAYTTTLTGSFGFEPPLSPEQREGIGEYIKGFTPTGDNPWIISDDGSAMECESPLNWNGNYLEWLECIVVLVNYFDVTMTGRATFQGEDAFDVGTLEVLDGKLHVTMPDRPFNTSLEGNAELEEAILADPSDVTRRRIYVDWLADHAHPSAIIAQLMQADRESMAQRFIVRHLNEWFGPRSLEAVKQDLASFHWDHGFVDSAHLVADGSRDQFRALLHEVASSPLSRLAHSLYIEFKSESALESGVKALSEVTLPRVRSVVLYSGSVHAGSRVDLSGVWPGLPNLEYFELRGDNFRVGEGSFPHVLQFTIPGRWDPADFVEVLNGDWPALVELNVSVPQIEPELLGRLFASRSMPKLNTLTLGNTRDTHLWVEALAKSPLLNTVQSLSLPGGTLNDSGVEILLEHRASFSRLWSFSLSANRISPMGVKALEDAGLHVNVYGQLPG